MPDEAFGSLENTVSGTGIALQVARYFREKDRSSRVLQLAGEGRIKAKYVFAAAAQGDEDALHLLDRS